MTLELMYGCGFAGKEYYMLLDGKKHPLLAAEIGTPDDARAAREKANQILKEQVEDLPTLIRFQQLTLFLKFKWDGTQ